MGLQSKRVLWVDNDPGYIKPFVIALEDVGCSVTVITSVRKAEGLLTTEKFDLLILDVMIPTVGEEEEESYAPEDTEESLRTGLIFYQRMRPIIESKSIPVLVMTVRIDKQIRKEFMESGLPESNFATKMELRDSTAFVDRVKPLVKS